MPEQDENSGEGAPLKGNLGDDDSASLPKDNNLPYSEPNPAPTPAPVYDLSPTPHSDSDVDPYYDPGQFNDPISGMTYGRRLARFLSMRFTTKYNPSLNLTPTVVRSVNEEAGEEIVDPPSLDKSWEFFEHHVLPRCFDEPQKGEAALTYNLAEPGERDEKTKLYPVWETPLEEMADFGIGVGMYFSMVRYFSIMCLIVGFLSVPNMIYYLSDAYSNGQLGITTPSAGSAICTDTKWQPCPTCEMQTDTAGGRITRGTSPTDGSDIMFILTNQCDVNERFGIMSLVAVFFVTISVFVFIYAQQRMRLKFDEQELTTSDFSILITNPPYNAKDPEIWKEFFESKFDGVHVTLCTVVLKNQKLIDQMVKRRKLLAKLKKKLPPHVKFEVEDLENIVLQCSEPGFVSRIFFGSVGPKELYDRIKGLDILIEEIAAGDFPVTRVFVTFEKEEMQQRVLKALTYPKLCKGMVDSMYKFDGHILLKVREPDEPSSIRWNDLDDTSKSRWIQRLVSYIICGLLIAFSGYCIASAHDTNLLRSTAVIILFNVVAPIVVKIISSRESHVNQTSYDTSVYIKITALRWINTVIVTAVETPFGNWIRDGKHLINAIHLLFIAELITRPILQLTDWMGHVKRHIFAPRAKNQHSMNMFFTNAPYSIGEKYTDVTKLLFLTCFYGTIYPAAWFFSAVILTIYFWLDKFCIMRTWKQGPKINADISRFSNYFFLACAITFAMTSAYTFAQFPFDDACPSGESVSSQYIGDYTDGEGNLVFSITSDDIVYKSCDQDIKAFPPMHYFQTEGSEWMNDAQIKFSTIFGWSAVGVLVASILMAINRLGRRFIVPLCFKNIDTSDIPDERSFSEVLDDKYAEIDAYVPQVPNSTNEFPFLMCNVEDIEYDLVGWRGFDDNIYQENNLVYDLPQVIKRNRSTRDLGASSPVFSMVKQWKP